MWLVLNDDMDCVSLFQMRLTVKEVSVVLFSEHLVPGSKSNFLLYLPVAGDYYLDYKHYILSIFYQPGNCF